MIVQVRDDGNMRIKEACAGKPFLGSNEEDLVIVWLGGQGEGQVWG